MHVEKIMLLSIKNFFKNKKQKKLGRPVGSTYVDKSKTVNWYLYKNTYDRLRNLSYTSRRTNTSIINEAIELLQEYVEQESYNIEDIIDIDIEDNKDYCNKVSFNIRLTNIPFLSELRTKKQYSYAKIIAAALVLIEQDLCLSQEILENPNPGVSRIYSSNDKYRTRK